MCRRDGAHYNDIALAAANGEVPGTGFGVKETARRFAELPEIPGIHEKCLPAGCSAVGETLLPASIGLSACFRIGSRGTGSS